jgi:hypothetical protein
MASRKEKAMIRDPLKWSPLAAAAAAFAVAVPTPALADAATHKFSMVGAADVLERGAGPNAFDCMMHARLRNVSRSRSGPMEISFSFPGHPGLDPGENSTFSFRFPALEAGRSSDRQPEHVGGMRCRNIRVSRISVSCDGRCGFVYVEFPDVAKPAIRAQKVQAGD